MKRSLFCIILITISLISSQESANALKQGSTCFQLNQVKKAGKVEFKCVGSANLKYWIQLPSVIPIQKSALQTLSNWATTVQNISFGPFKLQSDIDAANSDLTTTVASRMLIQENSIKSEEARKSYENLSLSFTTSAQRLTELVAQKKSANDRKLEEYTSALKKTNAYYSQYQAAISSRTATFSCAILKDFGFVGSCVSNPFQDALDVQTIRNYDALKLDSDRASAEYNSANTDWISTIKLETKEIQKALLASDTAEMHSQRYSEWKKLSEPFDAQQEYIQAFLKLSDLGDKLKNEFSTLQAQTLKSIDAVKLASKRNYKVRYQIAHTSVELLKLADMYYQAKVNESSSYLPLELTIEEPQIWKPTKYFKGSSYSDIENTSGIDFAWSWSAASACESTSRCKNLFVVTNKDCPRSVIELDFMTAAKVSESKTMSKEYSLKKGEISIVVVDSKFTETAEKVYLRSFKCNA